MHRDTVGSHPRRLVGRVRQGVPEDLVRDFFEAGCARDSSTDGESALHAEAWATLAEELQAPPPPRSRPGDGRPERADAPSMRAPGAALAVCLAVLLAGFGTGTREQGSVVALTAHPVAMQWKRISPPPVATRQAADGAVPEVRAGSTPSRDRETGRPPACQAVLAWSGAGQAEPPCHRGEHGPIRA